jgi:hypothetical protein
LLTDVFECPRNTPREQLNTDSGFAACLGCRELAREFDAAPQHRGVG